MHVDNFYTQNSEKRPKWALLTTEPSETVPDQSMSIAEIIQKYTRFGTVPNSITHADTGGNVAGESGADPMDEWNESMAAAARAEYESAQAAATSAEAAQQPESQGAQGAEGGGV